MRMKWMKHDDVYDYFDEDFDRMGDYLKLIKRNYLFFDEFKKLNFFNIRLSFDEVDKRCRRVPKDAPEIGPLSTI